MIYNAKNERITIGDLECDYVSFGSGEETLIMLPGVGDGFKTAKGIAVPFAVMYKAFAKDFKVYAFSRRNDLPEGFTTRDMADDLALIMEKLGIGAAHVFGVSQGGMIAEQLAINYPDKVKSLVLAVTAARSNDVMEDSILTWLDMADKNDYRGIMLDTAERSYTGSYLKRSLVTNRALSLFKPKDYTRFKVLAKSCLTHDVADELDKISCPTLVIGAAKDNVLGAEASAELAEGIKGSKLYIYDDSSHGVYEQAKDFNDRVLRFLINQKNKDLGDDDQGQFAEVNGVSIFYEKKGEGAPLIMVHGNGEDHTIFEEAAEVLKDQFTVYMIDSRDHGRSSRVEELHYDDMAEDIVQFIESLDLNNVTYYGFSDGGIIGILSAMKTDRITRLLISGANITPDAVVMKIRLLIKVMYTLTGNQKFGLMLKEPNIPVSDLKKIKVPTTVIAGENDLIKPEHTELIADSIPGAKLLIVPKEDHGSYIIHNIEIADIILQETTGKIML